MALDPMFFHRPRAYKVSVAAMIVSTLFIVIGYCTPHWVDRTGAYGSFGLWIDCSFEKTNNGCSSHSGTPSPIDDILRVPQIMTTLEVTGLVFGSFIAIAVNVRRFVPRRVRQRHFEVFSGVSGLLGFIGGTVFWVAKVKLDTTNSSIPPSTLSWSFFFVFLPSIVCVVVFFVVSCKKDVLTGSDEENITGAAASRGERRSRSSARRGGRGGGGGGGRRSNSSQAMRPQ